MLVPSSGLGENAEWRWSLSFDNGRQSRKSAVHGPHLGWRKLKDLEMKLAIV